MGKASRRKKERRQARVGGRLELLVTLERADPVIERRILLRAGATLAELHYTIQAAMGWWDSHLHEFATRSGDCYSEISGLDRTGVRDESRVRAIDVLGKPGDSVRYTYDFGDNWVHLVAHVAIRESSGPRTRHSECIGGKGACPPEDCGGVHGYRHLIAAQCDPDHPEHAELREWLEAMDRYPLDPNAFDLDIANRAAAGVSVWYGRT